MKTEWVRQSSCQYHTPEAATSNAPVGNILNHSSIQNPMIGGTESVSAPAVGLPSPQMLQNPACVGLYSTMPSSSAASGPCTCSLRENSQSNILHSILTGQGHKVGYQSVDSREVAGSYTSYNLMSPYRQSMVLTAAPGDAHSQRE